MPPIPVKYSLKAKLYETRVQLWISGHSERRTLLYPLHEQCNLREAPASGEAQSYHVSARGAIEDQNKKVTLTQQLLLVVSKDFMAELVKTFLAADIPLYKLRNPHVIQLFENLDQKMPSETVCRDYVKTLANNEQDHLKYLLKDKCIFICHRWEWSG